MNRVLITGGNGCLGSNLAARLAADGVHARVLHRDGANLRTLEGVNVERRIGDILDPVSLREAIHGCNTVIHTAALVTFAAHRRDEQLKVNVTGSRNVVDACIAEGVKKLVHVSSVAAVGVPDSMTPLAEDFTHDWSTSRGYPLSKHLAEQEILAGIRKGLPAVIVNPSVMIGERDINVHGGQLVVEMKRGLVPFYIRGGMSVVYVQDVVRGIIAAVERGRIGERYIMCGENMTHKEIFRRTARIVGGRAPFLPLPIPVLRFGAAILEGISTLLGREPWLSADMVANGGRFNWYDCSKAKRELGFSVTPFEDTIKAAYDWYLKEGMIRV